MNSTLPSFKSACLLGVTLSAVTLSGANIDVSKLPLAAKKDSVTYAKDVRPIFEASCFRCHGEEQQKGKLRLDSLEAALKGGKNAPDIIPGKSAESPLVIAISGLDEEHAMPPRRGPGGRGGGSRPGGPGAPGAQPGASAHPGASGQPGGAANANPGGPSGRRGPGGPQSKPLTPEQVGLIRAWIDQGAK